MRPRLEPSDGLPLPPARLRAQIGPRHADADFYVRSGREQAELVRQSVRDAGRPVETLDSILDWGCGCGRILRNWRDLTGTRVAGCDINPVMVKWCVENLRFADFTVNEVAPPLAYQDSSFDLVYGFSVMTHLSEELQLAWAQESFRILKPGGYFLFSTMGEHYLGLGRLSDAERQTFHNGKLVVLYERSPGTSLCSAYHPQEYVRSSLVANFEFVSFNPAADAGRHDIYLVRRPSA
jgi:SAM-dependent methyltransferase